MNYKYRARRALLLNREITWDGEISSDVDSIASVTTRKDELVSIFFYDDAAEEQFIEDATKTYPDAEPQEAIALLVSEVRKRG